MLPVLIPISTPWTIFLGDDLRVSPRGRTHRCAPTFRLFIFECNPVVNPHKSVCSKGDFNSYSSPLCSRGVGEISMMPLSEKLLAFAIVKHLVIFLIPELSLGTVANGYGFIIILA